jgi:hypothetical protein
MRPPLHGARRRFHHGGRSRPQHGFRILVELGQEGLARKPPSARGQPLNGGFDRRQVVDKLLPGAGHHYQPVRRRAHFQELGRRAAA